MTETIETAEQKTLTLGLSGYRIKGVTDLTPWGGGNACIEMKPVKLRSLDGVDLIEHLNDNGFGVQSINGAILDIFEDYEGTLVYIETVEVGKVSDHTREWYYHNY